MSEIIRAPKPLISSLHLHCVSALSSMWVILPHHSAHTDLSHQSFCLFFFLNTAAQRKSLFGPSLPFYQRKQSEELQFIGHQFPGEQHHQTKNVKTPTSILLFVRFTQSSIHVCAYWRYVCTTYSARPWVFVWWICCGIAEQSCLEISESVEFLAVV